MQCIAPASVYHIEVLLYPKDDTIFDSVVAQIIHYALRVFLISQNPLELSLFNIASLH
jgi:hypothetical protein